MSRTGVQRKDRTVRNLGLSKDGEGERLSRSPPEKDLGGPDLKGFTFRGFHKKGRR